MPRIIKQLFFSSLQIFGMIYFSATTKQQKLFICWFLNEQSTVKSTEVGSLIIVFLKASPNYLRLGEVIRQDGRKIICHETDENGVATMEEFEADLRSVRIVRVGSHGFEPRSMIKCGRVTDNVNKKKKAASKFTTTTRCSDRLKNKLSAKLKIL